MYFPRAISLGITRKYYIETKSEFRVTELTEQRSWFSRYQSHVARLFGQFRHTGAGMRAGVMEHLGIQLVFLISFILMSPYSDPSLPHD